MKILHVLETSAPHTVGYTVRAKAIIDHQRQLGLDPVVVTSPLFAASDKRAALEEIDGTRYYRTNHISPPAAARSKMSSYARRLAMIARYRHAVSDIARKERPDVIHAHSSYMNAYASVPAVRQLGVPLVYEVRTLWGEAAVIEDGWDLDSWKYKLIWRLELGAMRRANMVIPISTGIREELIQRGIAPQKLKVVPNGVDSIKFVPRARDEARAQSTGLAGRFVIGFVGSIRRLEGLSTLLNAYSMCKAQRPELALVIVGDGPERKALEVQAMRLRARDVVFAGNVPHADVSSWYSISDLLVYPRIRALINERVTPLKPLEAMALGKVCIGSDVGGLTELIRDDKTGVIFHAGDAEHLASCIIGLIDDRGRMDRLRQAALAFVKREREWSTIVRHYVEIYQELLSEKKPAVHAPLQTIT